MDKALQISILIIVVIIAWVSITNQMKISDIQSKIMSVGGKNTETNPTITKPEMQRDVTANELSSALRSKLAGDNLSELNVKFQQQ